MPKRLYMVLLSWCCVVLLSHRPLQAVPFPILDIVNPDKFDHPLTWSPHHLGSARLPEGTLAGWYDSNDIQANDIVFLPWHWGFKNSLTPGTSVGVLANGSAGSSSASIHTNFMSGNANFFVPGMLMKFDQDPTHTIYRVTAGTGANSFSISPPLASSLTQSTPYVGYVLKMADKSGFHRTVGAYPLASSFRPSVYMGIRLHSDANGADIYINGYAYARAKGDAGYLNVQHPFAVSNYFNLQSYGNIGNRIFQAPASGNHLVREVMVLNKAVTSSEREQLEGYLAWKWGFLEELPPAHPYVQAPPSGWSPTALQANLLLWLDANRPATLFADTECTAGATAGQAIACWQDLSGHGRHLMQGNALYRPLYTPSNASYATGLPGVEVQPNEYLLTANAATWLNNTNFTIIAVQNRIYTDNIKLNTRGYNEVYPAEMLSHAYTGTLVGVDPKLSDVNASYNPNGFLYFPHLSLSQVGMAQGLTTEVQNDYMHVGPIAVAEIWGNTVKYHPHFSHGGSLATRENADTWLNQKPYLVAIVAALTPEHHKMYTHQPCPFGTVEPQKTSFWVNAGIEFHVPFRGPPEEFPDRNIVSLNQGFNLWTRTHIHQPLNEKRLYLMWKQKANETPLFSINGDNAKNANYLYYHGNTGGFLALRSDILSVFALGDCRKGAERFSGTIYETIVIAGHVRYGHQRLIEGYLAWKWGIEKKLPRSHPYYRVPPRKS